MSSMTSSLKSEHQGESSKSGGQNQEETTNSSIANILDLPDEILRQVLSYLNARERLPLGNSCQRFKHLVFEDTELLRDLDFSKEAHLTSITHIQQYFNNDKTRKHVLKLNVRNVSCLKAGRQLNNTLGKAINVIDINIHGIQFKDIWQLACFLNPLIHVQRLSIDWPEMDETNILLCLRILEKPFRRLVYLSVKIMAHLLKLFIPSLRLCYELRELRLEVANLSEQRTYDEVWGGETKELRNLEIVEYCGPFVIEIKELLVTMLSEPEKWTDFQLNCAVNPKGFHLEKNVDVCEELLASKWTERVSNPKWNYFNLGWALFPECLLKEVLKINYKNLPDEFCCLSTFMDSKRCLLKIEDAKRLLKNPKHQISYLYLNHQIELGCDVHLVASAFPNLTELVLCAVTRDLKQPPIVRDTHFERRRKRRASAALEENCESLNLDSSFEMLVENTPHIRHLTLKGAGYNNWDLEQLYHIASWKNLETLRLLDIPIDDGYFLIEIARRCKDLQTLELTRLGSSDNCCYHKELLQTLTYCQSLRDFSIEAKEFGEPSVVLTALANNVQLRRIDVKDRGDTYNIFQWITSIEELIHKCSKLATITLLTSVRISHYDPQPPIERLKRAIGPPDYQISILYPNSYGIIAKMGTVHKDIPQPKPFR